MKKLKVSIVALIAGATLFASCDKNEPTPVSQGKVMVVHASPDAPEVNVEVDDAKVNTVPWGFLANSAYLPVNAGARKFDILAASNNTQVLTANATIEKDKNYTVWAVNKLANLEVVVTGDDLTAPAAGKAHVRFVHLSPDAPAVSVKVDGAASNLFTNVAFKGLQGFTPVDAGTYNLDVVLADGGAKVLDVDGVVLQAGKIYTVYANGFVTTTLGAKIIVNN